MRGLAHYWRSEYARAEACFDEVLTVCDPSDDSVTVSVPARNGYTGSVTLSATGLPAGATDSYGANPVAILDKTELSRSAGSSRSPGRRRGSRWG